MVPACCGSCRPACSVQRLTVDLVLDQVRSSHLPTSCQAMEPRAFLVAARPVEGPKRKAGKRPAPGMKGIQRSVSDLAGTASRQQVCTALCWLHLAHMKMQEMLVTAPYQGG